MSLTFTIPRAIYGSGFLVHSMLMMNTTGKYERDEYIKNMETQKETSYRSKFDAYWNGCRNGLFYGFIDSVIWPVKVMTFLYFVIRNYN